MSYDCKVRYDLLTKNKHHWCLTACLDYPCFSAYSVYQTSKYRTIREPYPLSQYTLFGTTFSFLSGIIPEKTSDMIAQLGTTFSDASLTFQPHHIVPNNTILLAGYPGADLDKALDSLRIIGDVMETRPGMFARCTYG